MMLDHALGQVEAGQGAASLFDPARWLDSDGARLWAEQSTKMWEQGAAFWTSLATLTPGFTPEAAVESPKDRPKDRRFADPDWTANPPFALIRPTYGLLSDRPLETTRQLSAHAPERSDERRVGNGCVSPCRSRWSHDP